MAQPTIHNRAKPTFLILPHELRQKILFDSNTQIEIPAFVAENRGPVTLICGPYDLGCRTFDLVSYYTDFKGCTEVLRSMPEIVEDVDYIDSVWVKEVQTWVQKRVMKRVVRISWKMNR